MRKATNMRTKYFQEEDVLRFICEHSDKDGLWEGNDATIAAAFRVSENEAYDTLSDLCDRNHIQRVGDRTYVVANWQETDDAGESEAEE